jgi:hypothetical protein
MRRGDPIRGPCDLACPGPSPACSSSSCPPVVDGSSGPKSPMRHRWPMALRPARGSMPDPRWMPATGLGSRVPRPSRPEASRARAPSPNVSTGRPPTSRATRSLGAPTTATVGSRGRSPRAPGMGACAPCRRSRAAMPKPSSTAARVRSPRRSPTSSATSRVRTARARPQCRGRARRSAPAAPASARTSGRPAARPRRRPARTRWTLRSHVRAGTGSPASTRSSPIAQFGGRHRAHEPPLWIRGMNLMSHTRRAGRIRSSTAGDRSSAAIVENDGVLST